VDVEVKNLQKIKARVKDNLWRAPGYAGLVYVVAWWYAFWMWYMPLQEAINGRTVPAVFGTPVVDAYSPMLSFLFISVGLAVMLIGGFLAYVLVFHK
jgi:hypothetical protein